MSEPPQQPVAQAPAAAPAPAGSAWGSGAAWLTLAGVTVFSIVSDLLSKHVAFRTIAGDPVELDPEHVRAVVAENAAMVSRLVPRHEPVTVVPHVLDLTLVLNPGAVFGVAPGGRWFFVLFTGAALAFGLWMFGTWTRARDRWAHVAIGLVIGGGLGNVYDRLLYGCVRDFLHPLPGVKLPFGLKLMDKDGYAWPYVSNVADLLLLIGIAMLLVFLWRRDGSHGRTAGRAEAAPDDLKS